MERTRRLYSALQLGPDNARTNPDLHWLARDRTGAPPAECAGIAAEALAAMMIADWHESTGGDLRARRTALHWGALFDDPYAAGFRRPSEVTAVYLHATARAITNGHPHLGAAGAGAAAAVLLADATAVLLTVLDRYLSGASALSRWFLNSWCDPRVCAHHGDGQGTTRSGRPVAPLVWATMPAHHWNPASGAFFADAALGVQSA